MTTLTPEQARAEANKQLAALYAAVTDWTEALFDQALLAIAGDGRPFSANDLWQVLPDTGRAACGLYFASIAHLRTPQVLIRIGYEPSVNPRAHGKPVNVYCLTAPGRDYLKQRQAARAKQRKQAA
ncbi:hypothetical protein [Streptomyces reticuli]|uniref:hypothetical protein n=1 Tax=Streptomyces reticuli TaxID=1926 RepID=UPI00073DDE03|nr:hypothetical protein [Streptomyces sp. SID7810]CUW31724.1 hypothetical protein TUE45_06473 [Streptomyces reticuli]